MNKLKKGTTSLSDWYIDFTFDTAEPANQDTAVDLGEAFKAYAASVSLGKTSGSVSLTVEAANVIEANAKLPEILSLAETIIGEITVTEVETRSEEAFDAWLDKPAFPDLVGLKEIAEILDVSSQRANVLVKQEGFPTPVLTLSAGQFRTRAAVESWASTWTRKPGRRRIIDANKTDFALA